MDERKFIEKLQGRAQEQERVMKTVPFPHVFTFIVKWLAFHPWRLLIPLAFLMTIVLRLVMGPSYTNAVLSLFRWWS